MTSQPWHSKAFGNLSMLASDPVDMEIAFQLEILHGAAVSTARPDRPLLNEDDGGVYTLPLGGRCAAVFDGMGGLAFGREVSGYLADKFKATLLKDGEVPTAKTLADIVFDINSDLPGRSFGVGGSTATVALRIPSADGRDDLIICSQGDSRAYVFDKKTLRPVTVDNLNVDPLLKDFEQLLAMKAFHRSNGSTLIDRYLYTYGQLCADLTTSFVWGTNADGELDSRYQWPKEYAPLFSCLFVGDRPLSDIPLSEPVKGAVWLCISDSRFDSLFCESDQLFLSRTTGEALSLQERQIVNNRHLVGNAIMGLYPAVPCVFTSKIERDACVVVVTDGVTDNLTDSQIRDCLCLGRDETELATGLLERAYRESLSQTNRRAKEDDITVCVI